MYKLQTADKIDRVKKNYPSTKLTTEFIYD